MKTTIVLTLLLCLAAVATGQVLVSVPDNNPATGGGNVIPFYGEWSPIMGEIRYQELYTPTMLGNKAFRITEVAYAPNFTGSVNATLFEVRMAHTTSTILVQAMDTNVPSAVTVYSGPITYPVTTAQWSPVGLTGTFDYNGTDSLVVEVRYKGGTTTVTTGSRGAFRSAPINRAWAYMNFNAPMWSGSDLLAGLKTQFTVLETTINGSGKTNPGGTVTLALKSPGDSGLTYQVGTSLGTGPTPIDTRQLGLSVDNMLIASTSGVLPQIFQNYKAVLDGSGNGTAMLNIPAIPALVGVRLHSAFLTIKVGAPSNVKSISNTFSFSITT